MASLVFAIMLGSLVFYPSFVTCNYDARSARSTHGNEQLEEMKRFVLGIEAALQHNLLAKREEASGQNQALISGTEQSVDDGALTASGSYQKDYGPRCSRLGVPKPNGCYSYGWTGVSKLNDIWIQVDLGHTCTIGAVATQGRDDLIQYVAAYKLASNDGQLRFYSEVTYPNDPKIFAGNSDRLTIVKHALTPVMKARRVRLYVITYYQYPSMRWELYGFPSICRC